MRQTRTFTQITSASVILAYNLKMKAGGFTINSTTIILMLNVFIITLSCLFTGCCRVNTLSSCTPSLSAHAAHTCVVLFDTRTVRALRLMLAAPRALHTFEASHTAPVRALVLIRRVTLQAAAASVHKLRDTTTVGTSDMVRVRTAFVIIQHTARIDY